MNSPLAFNSTVPTEEDILDRYKLKASDYNIFISSPLNRAIETLILFLNNKKNWYDDSSYKVDDILGKFRKILVNRCNGDIADKARGKLSKTKLSKNNLGKCGEITDITDKEVDEKKKQLIAEIEPRIKSRPVQFQAHELKKIENLKKEDLINFIPQVAGKRIRKTRKRKHKRKTRQKKNKKRKNRRRSIRRR